MGSVTQLRNDESGQALVEYALIITAVVVVSVVILTAIGVSVSSMYSVIVANYP